MGIYYYAVDEKEKQQIWAPLHFADKSPGVFFPTNPFPGMVIMMNTKGYDFKIYDDFSSFHDDEEYKDITEEVYQQYKERFPKYDWVKYEEKK